MIPKPISKLNVNILEDFLQEGQAMHSSIQYSDEMAPDDLSIASWPEYKAWGTSILNYLSDALPNDNYYLKSLNRHLTWVQANGTDLMHAIQILKRLIKDANRGLFEHVEQPINALASLSLLFNRFDQVAKQLRKRHGNRTSFDLQDEYDVQDLIYALLRLYFDDIEPEEYVPKYAGKGSRCDFALRDHNIIVEVKKTRSSLKDKEIGEELTLDIAKYSKYPNLKHLVCFVYDPDSYIRNIKGLQTDLSGAKGDIEVHLFIKPS